MSSIHVLTPATLSDRVFDELEQEIVSGQIAMGTKLGEEVLAARFGVSRGPLREALRRLEGRALVERTAHAGVRVVNLDTRDLIEFSWIARKSGRPGGPAGDREHVRTGADSSTSF